MQSELQEGQTYQNRRGDFRGPMRFVSQSYCSGWFVDQHGNQYSADGTLAGHAPRSTGNIDLSTVGATDGDLPDEFEWACKRETDERREEAELYRKQGTSHD